MWINQALTKNETDKETHIGVITDINEGVVTINSHTKLANVRVLNSFGISSMPFIGQEVLVLATKSDEYICIGDTSINTEVDESETVISSIGGGYIKLLADGSVNINGLTITADGQIIPVAK